VAARSASPLRRAGRELAAAWAQGAVKRGVFGTLAIELGSFTPAYLPQASSLWGPLRAAHLDGTVARVVGTVVVMVGVVLLVDGWFRLRHGPDRPTQPWAILLLWSLPFLFGPPIFSHDAYSYAAQGWLLHNHLNPYEVGPGVLPGPFADHVSTVWRDTPAPYGPLALVINHGLTDLSGFYPSVAALLQRVPAVLSVTLIVSLLPRLGRAVGADPTKVVWFACLNPILVIDFVGGAHNDALMMAFVVLALWLAQRGGWWWLLGAVAVGTGAAVKQPAFLAALALPLLGRPLPDWRRPSATLAAGGRMAASLAVAVGAFVGWSYATGLGFGWLNALNVPGMVSSASPTSVIGEAIQAYVNSLPSHAGIVGDRTAVQTVHLIGTVAAFAAMAVICLWLGRTQPLRALAMAWLTFAVFGQALHSWYILWGGLILPLTPNPRAVPRVAVGGMIALLSYAAMNLAARNGIAALGFATTAVLAWLVIAHELGRRKAARLAAPAG
jgi:hypothetical protein